MAVTGWGDITLPGITGSGAGRFTGDVKLPLHTLAATGSVGSVGTLAVDLPLFTFESRSGAVAYVELPMLTFDGAGTAGVVATADLRLPSLTVDATGVVRIRGLGLITLPGLIAAGQGIPGEAAVASLTLPVFVISASGSIVPVGDARITLPALTVYGEGTVAEIILAMASELSILAFSKYSNYSFNSMCKFGNVYLGCTDEAIYSLDNDDDAGVDIDAHFESAITDFGLVNQKRLRKLYLGGESKGKLKATAKSAEGDTREYTIDPWREDQQQIGIKTAIGRDGKSRFWGLKIENISGCNFAIDSIDAKIVVLAKKPKGEYNFGRMLFPMFTVLGTGS